MVSKIDELEKIVEKFEDSLKLNRLQTEKRFTDLEIKLEELNKKFKEVGTDFPELKRRSEEIENLLHVINLGVVEYKKKFEDTSSRISEFERRPREIERVLTDHRKELKVLREGISKISAILTRLDNVGGELDKRIEEAISSRLESLKEGIERNRLEIEHTKKSLDGFSSAIKSFERTIELTNIDDIIRRFNSLDKKITETQTSIEGLRKLTPDISIIEGDTDALKTRVKEMSSTIMDALSRMNEFELNVSKKMISIGNLINKAEKLEYIESACENVKRHVDRLKKMESVVVNTYKEMSEKVVPLEKIYKEIKNLKTDIIEVIRRVDENRSVLKDFDREGFAELILGKKENREKIIEIVNRLDEIEDDLRTLRRETPQRISVGVGDEIESMKKIINKLAMGNEELRKSLEKAPVSNSVLDKIDKLEEKIIELGKQPIKPLEPRPTKEPKKGPLPRGLLNKVKELENKIKELEGESRPMVLE